MDHSKEPWVFDGEHETRISIKDADGNFVASVNNGGIVDFPGAKGNAQRIIDCINACRNVPSEHFRNGAFENLLVCEGRYDTVEK